MTSIADGSVHIQTSSESVPSAPSWFGEIVLMVTHLKKQGVLTKLREQVRFARKRFGRYEAHGIRNEVRNWGPRGGESLENLAKTAEMCLPEKKTSAKGREEDDRSYHPDPGGPDERAEHALLVWGSRRGCARPPAVWSAQSD